MLLLRLFLATTFALVAAFAQEVTITYSPVSPSVSRAAYGKLPKDVQVWAIGVQGPIHLSEVRRFAVTAGYPVLASDMVSGLALKGRRTSWLTIFPAALRYGAWGLTLLSEKGLFRTGLPAAATALGEVLQYLPERAASEKFERLQSSRCQVDLFVPPGQNYECTLLTLVPPGVTPEAFRVVAVPTVEETVPFLPQAQ